MILIILTIGLSIAFLIYGTIFICEGETREGVITLILFFAVGILIGYGLFHGYINYPKTEGTHQGVITAVDLEGVYFRRYEVYLKSSGYTNQSDETKYLIYEYETDLAKELQEAIGKQVKLHYGHDGGYMPWNSCRTYHIKSVEIIEN